MLRITRTLKCLSLSSFAMPKLPSQVQVSCMSVYNAPSADTLWKTMAGVSMQGRKRGRARNLMRPRNLNRGKQVGYGAKKVDFPSLTSRTLTPGSNSIKKIDTLTDEAYDRYVETLASIQDRAGKKLGRRKISNLERGWTGGKPLGKRFGAPKSPFSELKFEGFDSVLLEFKMVFHMEGNLGRVRRSSTLMVTGNGNGTVGYSLSPGKYGQNFKAWQSALNKAGLRLVNIERYEDRTVYHDFFTQYGNTRLYVEQRPSGHGIVAQRGVRAICEMAGIKDIFVKTYGSNNIQSITKAFLLGLMRQKTHQVLADEKRLHLVEMRPENDYFPRLLASPSDGKVRTQEEIGHNEILDFQMISFEGRLPREMVPRGNPWEKSAGWEKHLRKGHVSEHHARVRERMRVENGEEWGAVRSHLFDQYPECVEHNRKEFFLKRKREKNNME